MRRLTHIDLIIKKMGYANSSCLKYKWDGVNSASFSTHTVKILEELSPYAFYLVDSEPFVLFFEESFDQEKNKRLNKKIWNAQIPVAIVCGTGDVKIYNGCSIDRKNYILNQVECLSVDKIDENSPFSYWDITNQDFWNKYTEQFSGEKLNDRLLRNLSDITEKLRNKYFVSFATKLMLRLIFIRYLIDRGVDLDYDGFSADVKSSRDAFLLLLTDKKKLYELFSHLKDKFNGNLFEFNEEINDTSLTVESLTLLHEFLSANINTETGQLSFFDLYDFNIIPVELISNIYEILLGKEERDKDNAFYTPRYLVNYILDNSVSPFVKNNKKCKVLDPSCGSGIFLVESYRRMVEKELNGEQFTEDDELLQQILIDNIYGVDLNKDAIDVAIFSLYLAVLDYKNPKMLKRFVLPNLKGKNLFVNNFFDCNALAPLQSVKFDFIVGNPPWGKGDKLQSDYCKTHGYKKYMQKNDTCRAFIFRSKDFSSENTQCCFVIHSKLLYMQKQPSKDFRKYLLNNTVIIKIVELSSVRKLIFKNADAPAAILSYRFSEKNVLENRFEYISMKSNIFFLLFNIIVIEKNDVKYVKQQLLSENDWAWKTLIYGLTGDITTILMLKKNFRTLHKYMQIQTPPLISGTGVQYNDGDKKDAFHLYGKPLLESEKAIDHFTIALTNIATFSKNKIHRTRNKALFQAPYCLMLRGMDMSDYTMKAVYEESSFVFKEAVFAVKGTLEQKKQLLNIVGLLNSKIYAYFNLMLGSSLGVEREQRQVGEVLEFPFVESPKIAEKVELIQSALKQGVFTVASDAAKEIEELNSTIIDAFQLGDNVFVDYALHIQIPQLAESEHCEAYRLVQAKDLVSYAKPFYEYLSAIFKTANIHVAVNVYPEVAKHYSAMEVVLNDSQPQEWIQIITQKDLKGEVLSKFAAHKINDLFFELKDVVYFEEKSFYIIKPNLYKNWHPAIAQIDLMEVADQILSRNGGNN